METYIIGKNSKILMRESQCSGIEIWDLEIEEAEFGHMSCKDEEKMHCLYVKKGTLIYQVNQERVKLQRGEGIFVNAKSIYRLLAGENGKCEAVICFIAQRFAMKDSLADKFLDPLLGNQDLPYLKLDRRWKEQKRILDCLERMEEIAMEQNMGYPLEVKSQIYQIWAALYKEMERIQPELKKSTHKENEKLRGMLTYLHEHYKEKITLTEIAENLGISTGDYCRFFKKHMQQTPFEYLQAYRIEKSIPELLEKADRINELALRHGFHGSSYYAETFRKEMGCTPGEYRKWYLGEKKAACPLKKSGKVKQEQISDKRRNDPMPAHLL